MVAKWWLGVASAILFAACGTEAGTQVAGKDAGIRPDATQIAPPEPDAGSPLSFDASIVKDEARALSVVGDPAPTLQYGQTVQLTALLVGTGVGAIANAPVTFTLTGDGQVSAQVANTSAAGIASVTFTAPATMGTASVTASGDKVSSDNQAVWLIRIVKPQRALVALTGNPVALSSSVPAAVVVKLTEGGKPLAGGKVTYTVTGSRQNVTLNKKGVDSDIIVTGIDGTAKLALAVGSVASDFGFSLKASADYATSQVFAVNVTADVACSYDTDCSSGQKCDTSSGKCVSKPECTASSDCNTGYTCSGGHCVMTAASCTQPSDCGAGYFCDTATSTCVKGCQTSADCVSAAPRTACDPGKHICVFPTQLSCSSDADCPAKYKCDGVRCVLKISSSTKCATSADCPMTEYCNTNNGVCTAGCDSDALCSDPKPVCDLSSHTCVPGGCLTDDQCFPQVCDLATGQCLDAPAVIYDVSGTWNAVQDFHVKGLTPPDVQSALGTIDTVFGAAQAVVDCHVSKYLPDWLVWLLGSVVDDAVCGVVGDYVPDWVKTVVHIGADISKIIEEFEIHSVMVIQQPGKNQSDKHSISGVDTWNTAYFFWYTNDCPSPGLHQPPPQCAYVEVDLNDAMIAPSPSAFTGRVDDSTLSIDTHQINFKFGKAVLALIDKIVSLETGYATMQEALMAVIDCAAINDWIKGVVASILGDYASYADAIDLTGVCDSAKQKLVQQLVTLIGGLNSDVPMSLKGKAGIVLDPGNGSNVADHLNPGVWYGKFNGQGDDLKAFGEWYADRP